MDSSEKKKIDPSEENAASYGGYSTRHDYERLSRPKKGHTFAVGAAGAAILCLLVLSALGIFALVSGKLLPKSEAESESLGSIRVPTRSELLEANRTPTECLDELEPSMLTLEVKTSDGKSRFGSGFVISVDGYAVCSTFLLPENGIPLGMTAHFTGGLTADVHYIGKNEKCGVALLKINSDMEFSPVNAGNFDFVKRGETLLIAGSVYTKFFYGTAVSGMVASVGETIQAGTKEESLSVPLAYLDITPNDSLYGAPVLNESGLVVGFCTNAVKSSFGELAAVIPINAVYTVINDILANS
ncbi:MAG: trypsin-like peptidase domain-containing protein [Clostridia bacterium]|nr:trypsin-like peptidase domain-containing protein [Clostridia bacterium]